MFVRHGRTQRKTDSIHFQSIICSEQKIPGLKHIFSSISRCAFQNYTWALLAPRTPLRSIRPRAAHIQLFIYLFVINQRELWTIRYRFTRQQDEISAVAIARDCFMARVLYSHVI